TLHQLVPNRGGRLELVAIADPDSWSAAGPLDLPTFAVGVRMRAPGRQGDFHGHASPVLVPFTRYRCPRGTAPSVRTRHGRARFRDNTRQERKDRVQRLP